MKKVFCIGLHKTGTASLREALKILGYKKWCDSHDYLLKNIKKNDWKSVFDIVKKYDGFKGWPWAVIYKQLDINFPNSKFILTIRDEDSWIKSSLLHFWDEETPMRRWIFGYGAPRGHEKDYIYKLRSHNCEVKDYFKRRLNDLLIINLIEEKNKWEKICKFLDKDIPNCKFPHYNKSIINKKLRRKNG